MWFTDEIRKLKQELAVSRISAINCVDKIHKMIDERLSSADHVEKQVLTEYRLLLIDIVHQISIG